MESPKPSFNATDCCAFCREQLPPHSLQGADAWQSNFRAALCLDANGDDSIEITEVACLPDIDDDIDVPLTGRLRPQTVTISRDPRINQKTRNQQTAFCFHDWCYSILIWKLNGCPRSVIYKLARTLTADPSIWENICERRLDLDSVSRLQMLASSQSQPLFLSRLPAELRTYIWRYIGLMTPYSAFILVADETSRLAHHLHCPSSRRLILERGSHLSTKMISVFGTEYVQDFVIDRDCEGNPNPLEDTTGVKYVTSLGGICAIQLLGYNWESGWIGKIPRTDCTWHGLLEGSVSSFRWGYNEGSQLRRYIAPEAFFTKSSGMGSA
ncbi:hypothetical protein M430DRAFT_19454 [Amorphotheca resinae ATCC 22711]|uniref:Uncharacterized protein n=1 Tax=Amorphotheca resinae ATCC 22711 TaxID=857342 RepID=A0A2T3B2T3_AMORE|nr:hypothetical protein M430DRAFT_19454 [Amorphotheca resinae ATCC 22711]PSS18866.1 hypothetical protein M430DRAFT_19454 [Amorphotheca resinae ATCC 22711]